MPWRPHQVVDPVPDEPPQDVVGHGPRLGGLHQLGQLLEVGQRVDDDLLAGVQLARQERLQVVRKVEAGNLRLVRKRGKKRLVCIFSYFLYILK